MNNDRDEKIENASFKVGDLVVLKTADMSDKGIYKPPVMVVKKVFFQENEQFSKKNGKRMSYAGEGIQLCCIWFLNGKVEEKVFPEEVLHNISANQPHINNHVIENQKSPSRTTASPPPPGNPPASRQTPA